MVGYAALALVAFAAAETPLVTGNGYGFAVVLPTAPVVSKLFARPYRFERPDPKDPLGEGVETEQYVEALAWDEPAPKPDYAEDSHVVAAGRQLIFMPFGLARHALVMSRPSPGCLRARWNGLEKRDGLTFRFKRSSLRAIPLDGKGRYEGGCFLDSSAWAFMTDAPGAQSDFRRWQGGLDGPRLARRELDALARWRVAPPAFRSDSERRLWRRSEVILRMAQSRAPAKGFIVASVPDGAWFVPWLRDMVYATEALIRMGHRDEARAALLALFEARPVGRLSALARGAPYQISAVRYFGDGSEEPYFTYEGAENLELDGWGLVLRALGLYVERYGDDGLLSKKTHRGAVYESARDFVARPLLANLDPFGDGLIVAADSSIWEDRQADKKHFAFTTAAAISGLEAFERLARRRGDTTTADELSRTLPKLRRGFVAAYMKDGFVRGAVEGGARNEIDGAALAAIGLGVVTDTATIAGTRAKMAALKMPSGGYRRIRSTVTDPKIFEYWYERQEFVFVDFFMPGQLDRVARKAAKDRYHIPEMYVSVVNPLFTGAIGEPTGAVPMVGYGAGAFVNALMEREEASDPRAGRARRDAAR